MTAVEVIEKYLQRHKIALISGVVTFAVGMLVHLYMTTNKFFNYFEMGNIFSTMSYSQNDSLGLGRWFLPAATNLFTQYSSPLLNSFFVLLYMSLAAGLICELFGVKRILTRCLFGAVWVSFSGMASLFSYGVNSDALAFSILLAVAAIYLAEKWRWGMVAGGVILSFSIGIYQPYLAVAIGTAFGVLLLYLTEQGYNRKHFRKKVLRVAATLLLGFVLYYVILQAVLFLTNTELSNYHGVDNMTSFTLKGIAKGFVYSYLYFIDYFFGMAYQLSLGRVVCNLLGAAVLLLTIFKRLMKVGADFGVEQKILLLAAVCLLPLGVNAAPFLMGDRVGNGVDIYMMFPLMFLWAIFIRLVLEDRNEQYFTARTFGHICQWCGMLSVCAAAFSGMIICNQAYHRMDAMTQTTSALLQRMVAGMEAMPEWKRDIPVYFVNPRRLVNEQYEVDIPQYEEMTKLPGTAIWPNYNEDAIERFCEVYLHFPVNLATQEQKEKLDTNEIIKEMPVFPKQESIQVIDGVMVVKVSYEE